MTRTTAVTPDTSAMRAGSAFAQLIHFVLDCRRGQGREPDGCADEREEDQQDRGAARQDARQPADGKGEDDADQDAEEAEQHHFAGEPQRREASRAREQDEADVHGAAAFRGRLHVARRRTASEATPASRRASDWRPANMRTRSYRVPGSRTAKVAPESVSSSESVPPCASAISRDVESPSPFPPGRVVTKRWKMRSRSGGGTPGPSSATSTSACPSTARVVTWMFERAKSSAFKSRLSKSCRTAKGSQTTRGGVPEVSSSRSSFIRAIGRTMESASRTSSFTSRGM